MATRTRHLAPKETSAKDLHRGYAELLQEVRIGQTCVQYLAGFLMALAFMPRFTDITQNQRTVYVAALLTTMIAAALLTAPAPFHRIVSGHRLRPRLVTISHRLTLAGLFLLVIGVGCALTLVLDVIGIHGGEYIVGGVLASFLLIWFALPLWYRMRHGSRRIHLVESADVPVLADQAAAR
jgi:hypothetical protein